MPESKKVPLTDFMTHFSQFYNDRSRSTECSALPWDWWCLQQLLQRSAVTWKVIVMYWFQFQLPFCFVPSRVGLSAGEGRCGETVMENMYSGLFREGIPVAGDPSLRVVCEGEDILAFKPRKWKDGKGTLWAERVVNESKLNTKKG